MKDQVLPKKAQVVLKSLVTWASLAMFVLVLVAGQIAELFSGDTAQSVVKWVLRVVSWLSAAVFIIRRVTPVTKEEIGLLPQDS